jgi:hypothetical protein
LYVSAVFRTAAILREVKSRHQEGFPCLLLAAFQIPIPRVHLN